MKDKKEQSLELGSLGHRNSSCIRNRKYLTFSNLVMSSITDFEEMKRIFHDTGFVTAYTTMKQHVYKEQFYLYLHCISFRTLMLSQQDKNFSYECGFKCPGGNNIPLRMYSTFQKVLLITQLSHSFQTKIRKQSAWMFKKKKKDNPNKSVSVKTRQ